MATTLTAKADEPQMLARPRTAILVPEEHRIPRSLHITADAVTVDPADGHRCRACMERMPGPWGRRVHVNGGPGYLICDRSRCLASLLEARADAFARGRL